ncbi:sensor histidine kinase [Flavobacterium salilacus subsp. salilacus]|uniref:sensor histidine kinase n=1 Tax=Flavobacterium TaxID=237 RepID=UPI001074C286|nr:ATP-binding protein [Flavobacterium salilacus]KAF2520094.1 sensor histidine kinase [Flavobacterium salilacus subsp. salilacus]MBE1613990.1 sensor histidine kinase [Flavobacterium sp. SaA2.13]NDI97903.1 sensor histidine kinase [Flavobacterium salilacus subsp. altitudinum]
MAINFKKSYRFAVKSASYITVFSAILITVLLYYFAEINLLFIFIFSTSFFVFSFFVLQYRVEHFIYRRVKKIYDDVSLLESASLRNKPITTDMATLTREVQKFARDKKIEIETLKVREEYRREFMGNVSHELKTPLFTVQGYLLTLLDGAMNDKTLRKKYLQRAEKGVERLIYIVQDLDMISKFELGDLNLNYTKFNIIEVVQNVFDMLEMRADKKGIILMFEMKYLKPIMVYADRDKIQQVVTNLVVNSIKYGKEDGTTEVSIEDLVNNKIIVRVKDNGEGIEQKHIPRLFERFYRVDKSGARSEGGSGLGLAIVKHIIEGHDEKIYVESKFGEGSEFSFTLEKTK